MYLMVSKVFCYSKDLILVLLSVIFIDKFMVFFHFFIAVYLLTRFSVASAHNTEAVFQINYWRSKS